MGEVYNLAHKILSMINYQPIPIIFSIKGFHIYSYSLMLFLALLSGYLLGLREIKRAGLDNGFFTQLIITSLIGAFLGARLHYVIEHYQSYINNISEIFYLNKGGSSFGGFLGGFLFPFIYSKLKRKDIWKYANVFAPVIPLGIFLVRIGCFLNWDDYGTKCDLLWCVNAGDFPRHPTQIYESLFGLALFLVFLKLKHIEQFKKHLLMLFAAMYCTGRFFIELLRDSKRYWLGLTAAQITAVFIIILIAGFFIFRKGNIKKSFVD